jgi:hypothetical protein
VEKTGDSARWETVMGWVEKKDPPHYCSQPHISMLHPEVGDGSVWECDECKILWIWDQSYWTWTEANPDTGKLPWWRRWAAQ